MIPAIITRIIHAKAFQEFAATVIVAAMILGAFLMTVDAIARLYE